MSSVRQWIGRQRGKRNKLKGSHFDKLREFLPVPRNLIVESGGGPAISEFGTMSGDDRFVQEEHES